jgi:hypothetical protein
VLTTPLINLSAVSLTSLNTFSVISHRYQRHRGKFFIAGVNAAADKLFAGVNDTADKLFTGVNDNADKFFQTTTLF